MDDTTGFAGNLRIPYMPQHVLDFSAELPWNTGSPEREGSLSISGRYEGRRFADTGNLIKLDPYVLLHITVNQRIGKTISAFGSLRNILNARYVSFAEYPMPGITFTLGLRMNFEIPPAADPSARRGTALSPRNSPQDPESGALNFLNRRS
jgi:outer membrane receptor protein involved in Fe transport